MSTAGTVTTYEIDDSVLAEVLSRGTRPRRPGALSASGTFAWRGMLKVKHVPEQVADVIAIPVTFTVLFTYMFGGALAGSTSEYLQFLLPGTLAMTVVLLTMYSGIGLNTDLTTGVSDRFRSLPVWRPAPVIGALLGDLARYLLASLLVLGLGLLMGFRPDGGVLGVAAALGLILVFASSLSWVCTLIGVLSRTPSAVTVWSLVILFPLTLASNVFVDPATMPGWLQAFVDVNPVSHLVTAVRGVMAGEVTVGEIGWVLLASGILVAVFAPLTMRAYHRRS